MLFNISTFLVYEFTITEEGTWERYLVLVFHLMGKIWDKSWIPNVDSGWSTRRGICM